MEKMDPIIPIREIRSGMKNINVYFIVLEIQVSWKMFNVIEWYVASIN